MKKLLFTGLAMLILLQVWAQVPKTISFQGYLTDKTSGEPLTSTLDMRFSLFDAATGGNELWFDDYSGVSVTKGLYYVILGDKKELNLPFDKIYYLQIKIGLENLDPRVTLTSSAYSLSGINATTISSGTLANARLDANLQDLADGTLSGSKIGAGINAANVTDGQLPASVIPNGAITTARIGDDQVTLAKIGTSGATDANKVFMTDGAGNPVLFPSIGVTMGGTGATNVASARANLGAAASGANSDITALSGLSTAITTAQGGTGATTPAAARTSLGLAIGTNVQAFDLDLNDFANAGTINGSKIVPSFGAQAITTTSSATVGNGLKVGSGTPTAGNLEVDNYTKLGATAPSIKTVVITNTTAASQGSSRTIALSTVGITGAQILSADVIVEYATGNYVPAGFVFNTGYHFNWYYDNTSIYVANVSGASASILSRPLKIFITYQP